MLLTFVEVSSASTHVDGYTYSIEFRYYTRLSSPADRPELLISFGDGTHDTVPRVSIQDDPMGTFCYGDLRFSIYQKEHTFSGPGIYVITMDDQNRNGGIINIPNSIAQSFCISATLVIDTLLGPNNSVHFENHQSVSFQNGWYIEHPLDPFDPDGDSLSFEAVTPLGISCQEVVGYQFLAPSFIVNPQTGHWQWTALASGEYNVTIRATEWRDGVIVGQVIRDMTVCILPFEVGIDDRSPAPTFTISPTLTEGPIRITTTRTTTATMQVFSSSGALVLEELLQPGEQWLDLGRLGNGLYLVRVEDPSGAATAVRVMKH